MPLFLQPVDRASVVEWTASSYPWRDLRTIWANPAAREEALSNTKDWGRTPACPDQAAYDGEVYTIVVESMLAGITGWFGYPDGCKARIGLRWHGILPQYRRSGVGADSLRALAARVSKSRPEAVWLTERIPDGRVRLANFFTRLGFRPAPLDTVYPMTYCPGRTWEVRINQLVQTGVG